MQVLLNLGKGGMESMAVGLAAGLRARGYQPVLVALDRGGEHEAALREADVPYHVMGGRRWLDPRAHLRLAALFRRLGAAVVHTHHFGSLFHALPATGLAGTPRLVHTEHSFEYLKSRGDYRLALGAMALRCDAFAVVGHSMADYYRDRVGVGADRLRVITNGIDPERYRRPADAAAARERLGLDSGVLVGTAGRLFPEKDYGVLIRAFHQASAELPALRLAIIGDGPLRGDLEALARSLGIADRVRFLGWREDVAALLPLLDLFVLSSLHEALPLVILEAMASGVPVVSTPVGEIPAVVGGSTGGAFFPVGDVPALAALLGELGRDPQRRERLGSAARERVRAHYGHATMVDRYLEAYGV